MRLGHSMFSLLVIASACTVSADSVFPYFVEPDFHGQPNTTFQEWNGFTTATGQNIATLIANSNGNPIRRPFIEKPR